VAQYTPSGGSNLITSQSGALSLRVELALLEKCQQNYNNGNSADQALIARIMRNPAGYGNQFLPFVVAIANVASPGTDTSPNAPLDSEIQTTVATLWPVASALGV